MKLRNPKWFAFALVLLNGCSSRQDDVGTNRGSNDEERSSTNGESDETPNVDSTPSSVGSVSGVMLGKTETTSDATSTHADAGSNTTVDEARCPVSRLSVALHFDTVGETRFSGLEYFTEGTGTPRDIDVEVISTPGIPRDPSEPWELPLEESEWDRSRTPKFSCTLVFSDVATDCYDLRQASILFHGADGQRIGPYNFRESEVITGGCRVEPGCPSPVEPGPFWGYYIVSEGEDTRIVFCGTRCDALDVYDVSLTLSRATTPDPCTE